MSLLRYEWKSKGGGEIIITAMERDVGELVVHCHLKD